MPSWVHVQHLRTPRLSAPSTTWAFVLLWVATRRLLPYRRRNFSTCPASSSTRRVPVQNGCEKAVTSTAMSGHVSPSDHSIVRAEVAVERVRKESPVERS